MIAVPEDVLTATVTAAPVAPQAPIRAAPRADDVATLRRLIAEAARPLVLAGRSLDRPGGREALRGFLEQWDLPTVVSFRAQDLFPMRTGSTPATWASPTRRTRWRCCAAPIC